MTTATLIAALLSGTVIAAVISAVVNTWIARKKSLEEDRARVRTTYAEAFEAVAAYRELPYAIRRRRADDESGERHRLSEEARVIQRRLSYFRAWTRAESATVGAAYQALLDQLRNVAGAAARQAWTEPPVQKDHQMNMPFTKIDLRPIDPFEDHYIAAVTCDLQRRNSWRAAITGSKRQAQAPLPRGTAGSAPNNPPAMRRQG